MIAVGLLLMFLLAPEAGADTRSVPGTQGYVENQSGGPVTVLMGSETVCVLAAGENCVVPMRSSGDPFDMGPDLGIADTVFVTAQDSLGRTVVADFNFPSEAPYWVLSAADFRWPYGYIQNAAENAQPIDVIDNGVTVCSIPVGQFCWWEMPGGAHEVAIRRADGVELQGSFTSPDSVPHTVISDDQFGQ